MGGAFFCLAAAAGKQVEGRSATSYAPNETLTAAECAKMLLTLLGYRSAVEGYTGNTCERAVWTRAEQVGLLKNPANAKSADVISRENASTMIANALQAKTVSYESRIIQAGNNAISCNYTLKEGKNLAGDAFK